MRTGVPERLAAGLSGTGSEALRDDHRRAAAARQAACLDRAERHAGPAGGARAGACRRLHAVRRRACAGQAGQLERGGGPARRRAFRPQARRPRPADRGVGRSDRRTRAHGADALFGRSHPGNRLRRGRARRRGHGGACAGAARRRCACGHRAAVGRARPAGDRPRRLGAAALCGAAAAGRQPLRRARAYRRRQRAGRRRRPGAGQRRGDGQPAQGRAVPGRGGRDGARISPTRRQRSTMPNAGCAPRLPSARWPPAPTRPRSRSSATCAAATVEGQRSFIEARIVAVAAGRPRIAV